MSPRTQRERSASTRQAVLDAAAQLFMHPGYAAVTMGEIGAAAGVTTGAVYHHFENKRELFAAFYEQRALMVRDLFAAAMDGHDDPHTGLRAVLGAFLTLFNEPGAGRVGVVDAPAVLGWERWRAIQMSTFLGFLVEQLREADARSPLAIPPEMLGPWMTALAVESGVQVATADDPAAARAAVESAGLLILDTFLPPSADGTTGATGPAKHNAAM